MKPRHPLTQFALSALPFKDAGSDDFPMSEILRLSLFQVSIGMATVMLLGTLNRVMIVELGVPSFVVAIMVALPVLIAPFRALLGFRSDTYRSTIGWRRIPFVWFGSLWQFGGLSIMPFALILLSGDQTLGPPWAGEAFAAIAFVMTGLGIHMTQTAGLALASDRATDETRPRVVALLYVMFLVGMGISAVIIGALLANFSSLRLIQVVQSAAVVTLVLNLIALWKQENMNPTPKAAMDAPRPAFWAAWADLTAQGPVMRLLFVVGLGTAAFQMQDVLLEPYGGEVMGLSVSATTLLTALWAFGAVIGFALSARWLTSGMNPYRMAARGILIGLAAFALVVFAHPMGAALLFYAGATLIGLGGGLFAVATLAAAMNIRTKGAAGNGLALGAWGAVQASAVGLSIAAGGILRDVIQGFADAGTLGPALTGPAIGYSTVYHLEIALLFATLIALGPLVRTWKSASPQQPIGLADLPS